MEQEPSQTLTLDAFLQQPETEPPSEYLDGEIRQKPSSQQEKRIIQGELVSVINQIVKPKQVACAFPEQRCTFGEYSIVPDVVVLIWDRIPDNGEVANNCFATPDWTIDILSPDYSSTKVTKTILGALNYGMEMGWLIDPSEQTVLIYHQPQAIEVCEEPEAMLPMPSFASNVYLTVKELFAWLSEEMSE